MKALAVLILAGMIFSTSLLAQEEGDNSRKIKLHLASGIGASYFHYNVRRFNHNINGKSYRFGTPNFRIGLSAEMPFAESFSLKTGLRIGLRTKRKTIYEYTRITGIYPPYTFYYLDEKLSGSATSFVEIPIGLQYSKNKFKFGISAVYRAFAIFTDGAAPDLGILPNLSYGLNDEIDIKLEYFAGSRVFTRDQVHNEFGEYIYYNAKDRFVQLVLEYKLKSKK